MIDKFVHSMADAMAGIADGSTILLGGFGDVGIPAPLLDGLIAQGARDLTIVAVAGGAMAAQSSNCCHSAACVA